MIEAVAVFAFISALFEFAIIMKLKPRTRLRLLGNRYWVSVIHTTVFIVNIVIHFGTITGSMTAVTAALVSFVTIPLARWISGYVRKGVYTPGVIRYSINLVQ